MTDQLYRWVKASEPPEKESYFKGRNRDSDRELNLHWDGENWFVIYNGSEVRIPKSDIKYYEYQADEPLPSPGDNQDDFAQFMTNSRDAFVKEINEQEWNQKLRTTAEDFLICFDQMRERIVKGGEDYQAQYADALEWIVILAGPLRELVEIKKLKDATGKTPEYENRQPMAWQSAFQCIELLDRDGGYFKKLPYAELAAKIAASVPSRPSKDIADELRKANPYTKLNVENYHTVWVKACDKLKELLTQQK